jgi:hypothetical protein
MLTYVSLTQHHTASYSITQHHTASQHHTALTNGPLCLDPSPLSSCKA